MVLIDGVALTETKIFEQPLGDVFHGVKQTDEHINGIAEAYFSLLNLVRQRVGSAIK